MEAATLPTPTRQKKTTATAAEGRVSPGETVDLSTLTTNYTASDDQTLTGKLGANVKISIRDGATVTLSDATINGVNNTSYNWAGITCLGDATIILEGNNSVKGFHEYYPGIFVPTGKTLTINGDGSLNASSGGQAAGIGGGVFGNCGNITINYTVHKVTATKGTAALNSIGSAHNGTGGTVTIGGVVGAIEESPYTYYGNENTSGDFTVNINTATYNTRSIAFWGRKITGHNSDDSYKIGEWEKLKEWKGGLTEHTGSQKFTVSRDYVELGFEFNVVTGIVWPYSGVFWKVADTQAEKVSAVAITFAGTAKKPTIRINVNGKQVYSNNSCTNHARYSWKDAALSLTLK